MKRKTKATRKPVSSRGGAAVWALAAVSSEGQSETLVHQRRWAEESAASHGWHLTRVIEGVATGKGGPRRIVRDLLADLRALDAEARPKKLLMIRADRLGRGSIVESQIVLRDLLELGVGVFTRDQGDVKLDSAMDELISAATLAVARHENEVRREKSLAVYRRKRAAGERIGSKAPYGIHRKNGKDVPDRERAPIVRQAFKLRLEGKGYDVIGRRLSGIAPPHVYLNGNSRAVHWTPTRVKKLLENRAYVGPIVTEAVFARAQRVTGMLTNDRQRDARRRYPWPLAGSMRCYCGRVLIGMACGVEPWRYRYYACRARWNHDGRMRLVRADAIEEEFVALLGRLRASPKLVKQYSRRASAPVSPRILERSIRDLKAKLTDVGRRRDAAWELHVSGKVRAEDVQERLDTLGDQRDALQGRVAGAQEQLAIAKVASSRERDVEALMRRAAQIFNRANVDEQNQIARAVSVELGGLCVEPNGKLKVVAQSSSVPPRMAHHPP
jgi:DNA invertase Pin-like site-specific DNA recombinase